MITIKITDRSIQMNGHAEEMVLTVSIVRALRYQRLHVI